MNKALNSLFFISLGATSLTGCWLAAGAAGAEGAYVATQENRTAGQTIDDQAILMSVKSKLLADPDVSGLKINVDVHKSEVTLRGFVATQAEIDRTIQLAQATEGVSRVDSRLVLDRP